MANQGPAYYSPYPAATYEGVITPPEGKALLLESVVDEETAMREVAKVMLTSENATIFPGPQVLYAWNDEAKKKETMEDAIFYFEKAKEIDPNIKEVYDGVWKAENRG